LENILWIGTGGFLGAVARYWVGNLIAGAAPAGFPLGTMAVNISGSLLLGFFATAGIESGIVPPAVRLAVAAGFLGAYTTYSTWSLETLRLIQAGAVGLAALNILGTVIGTLAGAWAGYAAGRMFG
jgi:fluoride exporter